MRVPHRRRLSTFDPAQSEMFSRRQSLRDESEGKLLEREHVGRAMHSSTTQSVIVLLLGTRPIMRSALKMLIESRKGLTVVGEAGTSTDALAIAARERPDIILLDPDFGDDLGLELVPRLLAATDRSRVVVLTGLGDRDAHQRAAHLGALGLVLEQQTPDVLFRAIEAVHGGELWLNRSVLERMLLETLRARRNGDVRPEEARIARLTRREREVIELLGEGLKNRQIADRLFISEGTVRHHLTSTFTKLGVKDRLELLVFAYRYGLTPQPGAR
jgi:DNA-binding NarL/FixJ family response regulator